MIFIFTKFLIFFKIFHNCFYRTQSKHWYIRSYQSTGSVTRSAPRRTNVRPFVVSNFPFHKFIFLKFLLTSRKKIFFRSDPDDRGGWGISPRGAGYTFGQVKTYNNKWLYVGLFDYIFFKIWIHFFRIFPRPLITATD